MDETQIVTLHTGVKDFLSHLAYTTTLSAYEEELQENQVALEPSPPPVPGDEELEDARHDLMESFRSGNHKRFWLLWNINVPEKPQNEDETKKLEFNLRLYFAIYPLINSDDSSETREDSESSMAEFKKYLESIGSGLSHTTEFVAYYALPYVPHPQKHQTFKDLFQESWRNEITETLSDFLQNTLPLDSVPYLYKLLSRVDSHHAQKEKVDHAVEITELTAKMKESEEKGSEILAKFAKLQGDYHNLIGIAAELVDSLERCVRGQMITPEYLQDICGRLFGSTIDNRPGSAAHMLRASLQNEIVVNPNTPITNMRGKTPGKNNNSKGPVSSKTSKVDSRTNSRDSSGGKSKLYPSMDFRRIKEDLGSKGLSRRKTLLLQALIWRLTKTESDEHRTNAIHSYISNDILGCRNDNINLSLVTKIFVSPDEALTEYLARFINVVASFAAGRQYLSQSEVMIRKLVDVLKSQHHHTLLSENILGGLQKLSLRRNVQNVLITNNVILWLLSALRDPDTLTDYALEYSVALLMNLCLRVAGKKMCTRNPEQVLKLLTDLLGFDNQEIRQYINGTLYSILALPSLRKVATAMCLEDVLKCYLEDESHDQHQLRFILKQLKVNDGNKTDDDVLSDGDDEDDDEEGDAIETESEKPESVHATSDEEDGERLLTNHYTEFVMAKNNRSKQKSPDDGPLTRPTTPRKNHHPGKSNSAPLLSNYDARFDVPPQARPHTTSSKNPTTEEKLENKKIASFKEAFSSRPKIPRSPNVSTLSRFK